MTPRVLDWCLNGVPVYINYSPVRKAFYATVHDFARFGVRATHMMRVHAPDPGFVGPWHPQFSPDVVSRVNELNAGPAS